MLKRDESPIVNEFSDINEVLSNIFSNQRCEVLFFRFKVNYNS